MFKIIHFSSSDCTLCISQDKVLRELSDDIEIKIQNQLITSAFDIALKYGVKSAPTLVILVDDRAIKVLPGFQSKKSILDTLEQLNVSNAPMAS